jgi:hypothetical protein
MKGYKLKYNGLEERKVFLGRKEFLVHKGDVFAVSKKEFLSFKDKKDFCEVK